MSTSGQGDEISEENKDDEPEISSTTSENKVLTETVGKSNEISAVAAIDPEDKALEIVVSDLPSRSFDKKPVTDAVIASSTAKLQENSDMTQEGSKLRVDTGCDVGISKVSPPKASEVVIEVPPESSFSDVTQEAGILSPKPGIMKDNPDHIQPKEDKDSSIEEDFKLRWDEDDDENGTTEPKHTDNVLEPILSPKPDIMKDIQPKANKDSSIEEDFKLIWDEDDDENGTTEPIQTDYVLQMLDMELGADAQEKPDSLKIANEEETIKSVKDTKSDKIEKKDEKYVISAMPENLVTVDKLVNQLEDNKTPKDAVELEKPGIEELKPQTAIEVLLKPLTKDDEVMEIDATEDIIEKDNNSSAETQKTIAELDKSTQDGEINKSTKVPAKSDKPITLAESDKQLVNVKMPMDEDDSEKPDIETGLKTDTVSKEIPIKSLIKGDDKMDVDESEETTDKIEITLENDILNEFVTVIDSYEDSLKTVPVHDSLTQDEIDKTVEPSTVTVDELDKHLEEVEIPKDKFIKSATLNTEELVTKTVSIEIPFKPLAKDDNKMDVGISGEKENLKLAMTASVSSVDDFSAECTQDNTMDSVQMEGVKSIKDKEVLDNIEDKQETSNISHDIIAEVFKPAETLTSENDILSTDKTIHKEDPIIPFKDEQNKTKGIEDISEIPQPVADKNKESDAIDTNKDLDDKLSSVQSIDSKSIKFQEINNIASSVQGNMKTLDEQIIVHKSSESQAVDDKVSTQDVVDETLKVQTILVTETGENSSLDDSFIDTTISPNKHHRINKPDVMLDIPTQDFSDIEAELSDSEMNEIEKSEEFTEKSTKIYENPSESNNISNVTPEISGVTTPTIQIDATTSKLNITTVSPIVLNQIPSIDVKIDKKLIKTQDILTKKEDENLAKKSSQEVEKPDDKPSSSKQVDDQQPCGSKDIGDDNMQKLTSDDADDVQESDSLGLLAVSSRVVDDEIDDDDEEPEDLDHDDNDDDDEDFDPYDESSSQMLGELEDTDESNPPVEKVDETEIIDADEQTDKQTEKQPDKITSILAKVLGLKDLKPPEAMAGNVLTYVELEGSSDSDDVEEISKPEAEDLISVKVPAEVDVMLTAGAEGDTSAMRSNKDEVVISVPKPHAFKVAKINTSEVTIKSATKNLESLQIPETTALSEKSKDEVFNIDSDDEEEKNIEEPPKNEEKDQSPGPLTPPKSRKCINPHCTSTSGVYSKASRATVAYYTLARRSGAVCRECTERASERSQALVDGIKDLRPLLELHMEAPSNQLVEISDSDEDDEPVDDSEQIGEEGAKFLLDNLEDVFSEVWAKYEIDSRLKQTETYLKAELDLIEAGAKELDAMLNECQMKTDAIRTDFYKDYEPKRRHLGGVVIHDTPFSSYSHSEHELVVDTPPTRYPKRRSASNLSDPPTKKPALSGELPDKEKQGSIDPSKLEEDKDISVVKLSAESAPASLPPQGELVRPALHAGMSVYAMRNAFGTWNKAKILEIVQEGTSTQGFTQCRVKFEHKVKNSCKVLAARCLAYSEPCEVRYAIGTRVVALFKDPQSTRLDAFYAGVVAEVPNPVNNYRYLVFFDDGYAQYIQHADTRLVCQASALVWEEVHPFIHDFVKNYLKCYPERPMVRLRQGETLNTEWNGKWWSSRVLQVDASIALIHFDQDDRTEWIYRGSTRLEPLYLELQAAKAGGRSRLRLPRTKQIRSNMPCVEYTRSDEQAVAVAKAAETQQRQAEEMHRQRAVAKKSTTDRQSNNSQTVIQGTALNGVTSRVVYYTPKHVVKPERMKAHACNPACDKRPELLTLKALRTYNPLAKPLLSGWERQMTRFKGHRLVIYRAPCGRRLRDMAELHRYLRMVESDLTIDLFDFTPGTHCLAEFMLSKCIVGKKDLSHGKENVPVACVNYYDDSLPEFCSYNTERTPTAGVPLNLDPDFLCGCDCTDDCQDKTKCACWKMTLEGARTIGLEGDNIGYVYRRLPEPLPSGIYECNSRCSCKQTCLNRVAQHPLQLKLQVFKTMNRGWGIRALNDVPKGAFLCVYAGNLLTDATANLDGLNEGDEYLAELDYIEVVEAMKEGYEDDVPETDKALDQKDERRASESESAPSSESDEEKEKSGKDDDFQPNAYIPQPQGAVYFQKSLRKRDKKTKKEEKEKQSKPTAEKRDDCITISDDEEVREPSRFTADDIADKNRKHSSRVSVRTLFGKDEACYIMDAKVQGNIGRYLNHSCRPNVFVQNVFVDTHDPRFPWVAFFALSHVRAGNELTWNYNYDVGSVPGKILYCFCGAANCRGRLL